MHPEPVRAEVSALMFLLPVSKGAEAWAVIEVKRYQGRLLQIWWAFYRDGKRDSVWQFHPEQTSRWALLSAGRLTNFRNPCRADNRPWLD